MLGEVDLEEVPWGNNWDCQTLTGSHKATFRPKQPK